MKNLKRILSILMVGVLAVSMMGLTAFAADDPETGDATIVIDEATGTTGSEWVAYRLLNLITSVKECEHTGDESDPHDDGADHCYNYAYTVNEKYAAYVISALREMGKGELADNSLVGIESKAGSVDYDKAIVGVIGTLANDEVRTFADKVYTKIMAVTPAVDPDHVYNDTDSTDGFENIPQGYYLLVERVAGSVDGKNGVYSQVILDTAGQEETHVAPKESVPTLEKEVLETNDTTGNTSWGSVADYDVNDEVSFRLIATLPTNLSAYAKYWMSFVDVIPAGLDYKTGSVVVTVYENKAAIDTVGSNSVVLDAASYEVDYTDHQLSVTIADLKTAVGSFSLDSNCVVVVTYTNTVNASADKGNPGNKNTAHLEFSNDPYWDGNGTSPKGDTPDDTATVFSFDLVIDKLAKNGDHLTGAGFKLYKEVPANTNGTVQEDGKYWIEMPAAALSASGDVANSVFTFAGIDAGNYKLVENVTPEGYIGIDPIEFTVTTTYDADGQRLTKLEVTSGADVLGTSDGEQAGNFFTIDLTAGTISGSVTNTPGNRMPGTGGNGVYAFYIGGGVLLIGAVAAIVFLLRKKSKEEDA